MNPEWLRYYIAAKLNAQGRGHRLQSRRLRRPRQQRPGRQVRQHRQPRRRLHRQALRRPAVGRRRRRRRARCSTRCARSATPIAARCYDEREFGKALREIMLLADKVNEYVDAEQAVGAGQEGRHGRAALHDVCSRLHRGLPPADDLPEAGAAGAGRAGRGASCSVEPLHLADAGARARRGHAIGDYKHLMQRVDAEAARRAVRAAAPAPRQRRASDRRPLPGGEAHRARRSRSTTSPRSTCASRRSSTASRSKARPSCCA